MSASPIAHELEAITQEFSLEPFAESLQPLIDTALATHGKDQYREETLLVPRLLVWFVLILTLRRDKNYPQVLNWLVPLVGGPFPRTSAVGLRWCPQPCAQAHGAGGVRDVAPITDCRFAPAGARFSWVL